MASDHRIEETHGVEGRLDIVGGGRAETAGTAATGRGSSSRSRLGVDGCTTYSSVSMPRFMHVPGGRCLLDLPLQDRPGAVRERLGAPVVQVGRHEREAPIPRQHAQGGRIGHGDAFVLVGRHLAEVTHAPWRVALVAGDQFGEVLDTARTWTWPAR